MLYWGKKKKHPTLWSSSRVHVMLYPFDCFGYKNPRPHPVQIEIQISSLHQNPQIDKTTYGEYGC